MNKIVILVLAIGVFAALAVGLSKALADHEHKEGKWSHGIFDSAHGGGLDKNGGHYDRQNGGYHYHR